MGSPLERRRSGGRRLSDSRDARALRGLLHDLGHEITTLSYLVEAVRSDRTLPQDSQYRLELVSLEMGRLTDLIGQGLTGDFASGAEAVSIRDLLVQLTRLAGEAFSAQVTLLPGPDLTAEVSPLLLWRVLSNVVDNAARAAGPAGRVTLALRQAGGPVIDIADDGPGFGAGPAGTASLGMGIVRSLLEACGGSLAVSSPPSGGTVVSVALPAPTGAPLITQPAVTKSRQAVVPGGSGPSGVRGNPPDSAVLPRAGTGTA
jgi:signal transduction histidine kinase